MEIITSRNNDRIVFANSLHDKKNRDKDNLFVFEGKKLFFEAIARKIPLVDVFYTDDNKSLIQDLPPDVRTNAVTREVYEKISCEKSPSGIFCVSKPIDKFHKFATIYSNHIKGRKIIFDSLRDPGNLGTVIRTAAALGIDEVILSKDCADIYNEKTVRAAMGTLFSQSITVCDDLIMAINDLKNDGYCVCAAALRSDSIPLNEFDCNEKSVFVVGNEGHGLDKQIIDACSYTVTIPMPGGAESLNAAIAAAILMWECSKRSMP